MKHVTRTAAVPGRRSTAVTRYRTRMRRQGLRLVQFWAPDVGAEGFADECRRQSAEAGGERRQERTVLEEIGALGSELDLGDVPELARPARRTRK